MDAVLYIHGKNGSAEEAEHFKPLFSDCEVVGLSYKSVTPWDAGKEIHNAVADLKRCYSGVLLIANSIGAYFSMNADIENEIDHAFFISPIVNMEKLIADRMRWANITEKELKEKGSIHTDFGEDLSWEYLCYARDHPVCWHVPTDILYGSRDALTSVETMWSFAETCPASLTIMKDGEHWFHTEEQMQFLDQWIKGKSTD